jgi:hypothetical protein
MGNTSIFIFSIPATKIMATKQVDFRHQKAGQQTAKFGLRKAITEADPNPNTETPETMVTAKRSAAAQNQTESSARQQVAPRALRTQLKSKTALSDA